MSVMTEARLWPIEDRPLTGGDLARTPDDGNRYELVDGVLVVTPAPNLTHQLVATRLTVLLGIHAPTDFHVVSPIGMNIAPDHHRIPDLAVVRTEQMLPGLEYPDTPPSVSSSTGSSARIAGSPSWSRTSCATMRTSRSRWLPARMTSGPSSRSRSASYRRCGPADGG